MLTVEKLKGFGANTEEGLSRCFGKADFYLRLVKMMADDKHMDGLEQALRAGDLGAAFENAHALKGVLANLSLTPVLEPVAEMTELLRARAQADYAPLMAQARKKMDELLALIRKP